MHSRRSIQMWNTEQQIFNGARYRLGAQTHCNQVAPDIARTVQGSCVFCERAKRQWTFKMQITWEIHYKLELIKCIFTTCYWAHTHFVQTEHFYAVYEYIEPWHIHATLEQQTWKTYALMMTLFRGILAQLNRFDGIKETHQNRAIKIMLNSEWNPTMELVRP